MSLVGSWQNLVLNYEIFKFEIDSSRKDEDELDFSIRLLTKVIIQRNKFIDIVTYDALACNLKIINHCKKTGVDVVIRVKKNNNNSFKEVKNRINMKEVTELWDNKCDNIYVNEEIFYMKDFD
jgi:hypothetical protein